MSKPQTDIEIVVLSQEKANEAFALVCDEFTNGSELHNALKITTDEYRDFLHDQFYRLIDQGLSLIMIDKAGGNMLGCLIAADFLGHETPASQIPARFKPLSALLKQLETEYLKIRKLEPGQCMLVDLAVVSRQARGLGIYRKLREAAHILAKKARFRFVVGELSSAATQHVCIDKMGHRVQAEIDYRAFEHDGGYPFAAIEQPTSIQLVEVEIG